MVDNEYLMIVREDPKMSMTERVARARWMENMVRTIMHDDTIKVYVHRHSSE